MIFEARGQYAEAEAAYRRAEAFRRASLNDLSRWQFPVPRELLLLNADGHRLAIARNEAKQGRLSAAEADARRALLEILEQQGKFNPVTRGSSSGSPAFWSNRVGIRKPRNWRARRLTCSARLASATGSESASILSNLGNILVLQRRTKEAATVYAELDAAVAEWTPQRRAVFELNGSRIAALYASGQIEAGIAAAEELVKREAVRTGVNSFDTAAARGTLAVGYARAGRDADATRAFKTAIPIMLTAVRENVEDDDPTVVAARSVRLQRIVEAYIGVLARSTDTSNEVAVETLRWPTLCAVMRFSKR